MNAKRIGLLLIFGYLLAATSAFAANKNVNEGKNWQDECKADKRQSIAECCEDKEGECKQSGENFDDCYKRKKSCTSNINETRTQRRKPAKIKEPRAQNES